MTERGDTLSQTIGGRLYTITSSSIIASITAAKVYGFLHAIMGYDYIAEN